MEIGNCSLGLGEVGRARKEFATAGLYTRAVVHELVDRWPDVDKESRLIAGSTLKWGLYLSVLSGGAPLVDAVADDVRSVKGDVDASGGDDWVSNVSYLKACALAALYERDDDAGRNFLSAYAGEDEASMTPLLVGVQRAMLGEDEQPVREALRQLAREHPRVFEDGRRWRRAFSHAAGAHLLVARVRSLTVTAEQLGSEHVPVALDEYDIADDLELPSPAYVEEDLIPR
jgi:hypothetical protein